ncbi:MAG: pyridoxine 5'-phosphate synthase [Bacteroidetes bacterium]|nr:MAG: pyridoxine 5'-phosphate synthase [Bacteroidota bacterium]
MQKQCRLSVNVNKVATLRNARGGSLPNLIEVARDCERFGAEGITIHPRPDERHITREDAYALKEIVTTEFNIEGYPDERYMEIIKDLRPEQATLVPDPPGVLTSNAGWDTEKEQKRLSQIIDQLHDWGVRSSIFVGTDLRMMEYAAKTGTQRVELYTGPYAEAYNQGREQAVEPFVKAALLGKELGMGINAGHDLNLDNLAYLNERIPFLDEVSIGHALICDSLYLGLENTIRLYRKCLEN